MFKAFQPDRSKIPHPSISLTLVMVFLVTLGGSCFNFTRHSYADGCICDPGWHGVDCTAPCGSKYFGLNCGQECRCRNNASCDSITGSCLCPPGLRGALCDKGLKDMLLRPDQMSRWALPYWVFAVGFGVWEVVIAWVLRTPPISHHLINLPPTASKTTRHPSLGNLIFITLGLDAHMYKGCEFHLLVLSVQVALLVDTVETANSSVTVKRLVIVMQQLVFVPTWLCKMTAMMQQWRVSIRPTFEVYQKAPAPLKMHDSGSKTPEKTRDMRSG